MRASVDACLDRGPAGGRVKCSTKLEDVAGVLFSETGFLASGSLGHIPSITASALSRTFSSTPLLLRAGSGVKGGPTVFVGPFIARPLTLRTARYNRLRTKRSFVLTRDSFAASDQVSSP